MIIMVILVLIFSYMMYQHTSRNGNRSLSPVQLSFIVYMFISLVNIINGHYAMILINLWLLAIGLYYINEGLQKNHLIIMNLGVMIIGAQILARFFEWNVSFVGRGVAFILVGCAFFIANYLLIKNAKV